MRVRVRFGVRVRVRARVRVRGLEARSLASATFCSLLSTWSRV